MGETDLSKINSAVGATSSGDASTQAANLMYALNGVQLTFELGSDMKVTKTINITGTSGTSGTISGAYQYDFLIVLIKPTSSSDIEMHLLAKTTDGSYTCCSSHQNNGDGVPVKVRLWKNNIMMTYGYSINRASWVRLMCVSAPGLFS